MLYPKNPYCPMNNDCTKPGNGCQSENNCGNNNNNENNGGNGENNGTTMSCQQLLKKISELEFAITELNLYLDTHPENAEALEMLTKLSASLKSIKYDYDAKCPPLCVTDVSNNVPFEWVQGKWPWQA